MKEMLRHDSKNRQCSPVGGILQKVFSLGNFEVLQEAKSCTETPHENGCMDMSINSAAVHFQAQLRKYAGGMADIHLSQD